MEGRVRYGYARSASCAIGHELVTEGHSVLFAPAYLLIIDDIGAPPTAMQIEDVSRRVCRRVIRVLERSGIADADGLIPKQAIEPYLPDVHQDSVHESRVTRALNLR
jgi:hypothetical protein